MQQRQGAFGTNRDFGHHTTRSPARRREPSDKQLLAQAKRDAARWQNRLAAERRTERNR